MMSINAHTGRPATIGLSPALVHVATEIQLRNENQQQISDQDANPEILLLEQHLITSQFLCEPSKHDHFENDHDEQKRNARLPALGNSNAALPSRECVITCHVWPLS